MRILSDCQECAQHSEISFVSKSVKLLIKEDALVVKR